MLKVNAIALRDAAAEQVRERLSADRRRASPPIALLVEYVDRHLFDSDLRYERMRKDCGIRDNNRSTLFRQELGLTPAVYIRDLRFAVASKLLVETELSSAEIGALVGYVGPNVFGVAFRRWSGVSPGAYRLQQREALKGMGSSVARDPELDLSPAAWRRFVEGELPDQDVERLFRFLLDRYPERRRQLLAEVLRYVDGREVEGQAGGWKPRRSLRSLFARADVERLMAEVVLEDLDTLPWEEQVTIVRHQQRFTTSALFELLRERSLHLAEPVRALELARLALEAARALRDEDDQGLSVGQSLAWASIARAQLRLGDVAAAEAALLAVDRRLPCADEAPRAHGACALIRALFAQRRGAWKDAAGHVAEATRLLELGGAPLDARAQAALQAATVHRWAGEPRLAAAEAERAVGLAREAGVVELVLAACVEAASCQLAAGDLARAREAIGAARGLATPADDAVSRRLDRLDALTDLQSGDLAAAAHRLEALRVELDAHPRDLWGAVVELDLAFVRLRLGDIDAAQLAVGSALERLESVPAPAEAADDVEALAEMLRSLAGARTLRESTLAESARRAQVLAELTPWPPAGDATPAARRATGRSGGARRHVE